MKRSFLHITFLLSTCATISNAQNLWQPMANSEDFFDMRYIYQDTTSGILYVGLPKKIVGGDTVNCITYWNGTKWDNLGNGASTHGESVSAIMRYHDTIFAAGGFSTYRS